MIASNKYFYAANLFKMKELAEQEINKDTCKLFNKVNKYKFQRSNGFTM